MDDPIFFPRDDVQEYFTDDYFIQIYEELTEQNDLKKLFEPLDFFNLLYEQIYYIKNNFDRPLDNINHLKSLDLNKYQLHFLLIKLLQCFNQKNFPFDLGFFDRKNKHDKKTLRFIWKELKKLDFELFKPADLESNESDETKVLSPDEQEFQQVLEHIKILDNTEEKIYYLNKEKTRYMQDNWVNFNPDYPTDSHFIYNCELEINRLKERLDTNKRMPENPSGTHLAHLTNSQVVLIFYYFYQHIGLILRKDSNVSDLARFMHLLMGKKYASINSSDYYKKLRNNAPNFKSDNELKKDLLIIKPLFQQAELKEIVKMIDNEINMCNP